MRWIWRLIVMSKMGQTEWPYYSKDKSLTLRSAASWRKSGYKVRVDRLRLDTARREDMHARLWGWPLTFRDRGPLNNSRAFRRYRARVTRPRFYSAKDVTVTIGGVVLSQTESISYTTKGSYKV